MYETEANIAIEPIHQIPSDVVQQFRAFRERVALRTQLPWGEHCTECVWPTCYTTCDLYAPREDGRCRRFLDGMVRIACPGAVNDYLIKIRFKRWGKLWAPGNVRMVTRPEADRLERRDQRIGSALVQLPLPQTLRNFATGKRYGWKKRMAAAGPASLEAPHAFIVECYNPGAETVALSLTMRASQNPDAMPFQKLFHVLPGFHRETVPVEEITRRFSLSAPFSVDLVPNEIADGATLYFGLIDFVVLQPERQAPLQPNIKCIVWDLDNTLWQGTLVEDGAEKLVIHQGVVEVIQALDRRGILHSIASKNNYDEAMAVLKSRGLDEYFLYPQISWDPKSESVKAIAAKLNIATDTLMLVDDSEFERSEVQSACPGVRVLAGDRYADLLDLQACQGQETEESANRRKMYQQEAVRESSSKQFGADDYLAFLRECQIEIEVESLSPANLERVHELTQRTNQMNFSGNRYERILLEQIAATKHFDTYVISCRDRFGSYGIVGFSVVDAREPRMTDLMFSCRIQAKRIEHAFLSFLLTRYRGTEGRDFWANYRKTPRNAPSGRVFEDIGMVEAGEHSGVISLVFRGDRTVPDDGVIELVDGTTAARMLCGTF